ncbi:MAG: cytochrome c-type biogenesis CcmF C-terminal domain-containing protein [Deinococcales bacterium]
MSLWLLLAGAIMPRAKLSQKSVVTVFKAYAFENRRRFGSMVVHLGVIVVALGVTGAGAYRIDEQVRVDFGSSTPFQSYTLKAIDRFMQQDPGQVIAGAVIEVWQNDRKLKTLRPSIKVFFHDGMTAQQPVPTPAIFYRFSMIFTSMSMVWSAPTKILWS